MAQQTDQINQLELHVVTPDSVLYNGPVKSISGKNKKGPFDILSYHTNFVSIIDGSVTIRELDGNVRELPVGTAIVKVYKNVVYVFVGIEQQPSPSTSPPG